MKRAWSAVFCVAALAACEGTTPIENDIDGRINVVNSVIGFTPVAVFIDGHFGTEIGTGGVHSVDVTPGPHTVEVRRSGVVEFTRTGVQAGTSFVVFDSSGFLRPQILLDTGAVVPANKSKLRVVHSAQAAGAIDLWRTQPDFPTPVRIMFPFDYGDESPYLQSDPGSWRVMVSTAVANPGDPMPDTLANSGLIGVPAGTSRTVVLVKSESGQFSFAVLEP